MINGPSVVDIAGTGDGDGVEGVSVVIGATSDVATAGGVYPVEEGCVEILDIFDDGTSSEAGVDGVGAGIGSPTAELDEIV